VHDTTLSLILPVRNAAAALTTLVEDCLAVLPRHFTDYEIIIVDDASDDTTRLLAERMAAAHAPVMLLHQPRPLGYGAAFRRGLHAARGDSIVLVDITSRLSVHEISRLLPYMDDYDILAGHPLQQRDPWHQRLRYALLRRLFSWLLMRDLQHVDFGLSMAPAALLHNIEMQSSGRFPIIELIARASQQGSACIQVGLHHDPRLGTFHTDGNQQALLRSLWELWRIRRKLRHSTRQPPAQWSLTMLVWLSLLATRGATSFPAQPSNGRYEMGCNAEQRKTAETPDLW
jgi:hypothetical protein